MLRKLIDMLAVFPRAVMGERGDADAILKRSDRDALRSDWQAVGKDISLAMDQIGEDLTAIIGAGQDVGPG